MDNSGSSQPRNASHPRVSQITKEGLLKSPQKMWLAVAIITVMTIASCNLDFGPKHRLNESYYLDGIDIDSEMSLYYDLGDRGAIGRIEPTVFAVGADNRYIIAKQHPKNNRSATNYFILDMTKDGELADPKESVIGPLTEVEFNSTRVAMGISPRLDFTYVIKKLM